MIKWYALIQQDPQNAQSSKVSDAHKTNAKSRAHCTDYGGIFGFQNGLHMSEKMCYEVIVK